MIAGPCRPEEAKAILAGALTDKTGGAGADLDELTADAVCMAVRDQGGAIVGAYVLHAEGGTLWIRAAAGRAPVDLCQVMFGAIAHQGRAFDCIGFQTRRAGLVKKAAALGYAVTGHKDGFTVMRKWL